MKHITKITIAFEVEGQKISLDATLSNIKTAAKLKDGLFAKPE
jgi:hypothetical protein